MPVTRYAATLLALASLLACAPRETDPPTLKLATWFGSNEAREMAPILAAINARHTHDFRVEMITIPGEYQTKLDTMMAGKLSPDLFLLSQEFVPSYAAIGAIANLDTRIHADPQIDLPDFYPAALETARWQGQLYGLPFVMMPVVMYYNKKLFGEAQIAYPDNTWNWAQFRSAAKLLTQKNPDGTMAHWGFLQHTWPPYQIWVWQNGGDVLAADQKTPTLTAPNCVEALDFMRKVVVEDGSSPNGSTVLQNGANELFKSGRVAMFFGGASDDNDRVPGLPVGVAELPQGRQRATFSYMAHLVMSPQTRHADLAYVAWRELLDGFYHWKIVPPRRSLAKRLAEFEPRKAASRDAILASMEYARGIRGVVEQTEWDGFVLDFLLDPLLGGKATASDAAATTQAKLTQMLEATP